MAPNQTSTQSNPNTSADETKPTETKVPDGRRNSAGEEIPSPVASWKPNFARQQSWNREDLKREHTAAQLGRTKEEAVGKGFTEVGGT